MTKNNTSKKKKKKQNKVVELHKGKRSRINLGIIVFGAVFLYLAAYSAVYLTRDKITYYEVVEGSSSDFTNDVYTGIVLRDETVVTSEDSGYINYYVSEGDRVNSSDILYSIDENGYVSELLASVTEETNILTQDDLSDIRSRIIKFCGSYPSEGFPAAYDLKYDLNSILVSAISMNALDDIYEQIDEHGLSNVFQIITTPQTGIVVHSTDGYESLALEDVTASLFDTSDYAVNKIKSNDLVSQGEAVGKIVQDEKWQIVIPLSEEDVKKYSEKTTLDVCFLTDGIQARCNFEIMEGKDGASYGVLTFYRFMLRYVTERYLNIQIQETPVTGLKIPKTAVAELELYTIPVEYYVQGGDSNHYGFYLQGYDENGNATVTFITPTVYDKDENYCYVSKDLISPGDIVVMPDSTATYKIGSTGTVQGAYQINSGYTIFKEIEILAESNEYYIISDSTAAGLVIYDHIVLDAEIVDESQIVYQ